MYFEKEIERAVRHQASLDKQISKTQEEIKSITTNIKDLIKNSKYDFSDYSSIVLKQNGKKRFIKRYKDLYSTESILCQCIKQILDRAFKVQYPNRNKTIKSIFGFLSAIKQMSEFTIIKFDFKDYFNSLSAIYIFEKILKLKLLDRFEANLVKEFVYKTKYSYAGFNTSNVMAEIISKYFDEAIRQKFISKGILYFERYIDDSILILNRHIEENNIKIMLNEILQEIFHDNNINTNYKCKTSFNDEKFQYISKQSLSDSLDVIDFLGYEFGFSLKGNKVDIKYGITKDKRDKYNNRLDKLIFCYSNNPNNKNLELLRHMIIFFTSRTVYINKRFRSNIWKVKGFISNYGELRYLLGTGFIEEDTEQFLKNMVDDAFVRAKISKPYFLKNCQSVSGYNLFNNMKANKTILLVEYIGYNYDSLVNLCKKIDIKDIDINGKKRGYGNLVRDYLIKVKVGY